MNVKDRYGVTALMCATFGGHNRIVKTLLSKKATPDAVTKKGALEWAQLEAKPYSFDELVLNSDDLFNRMKCMENRQTVADPCM